MKIAFVSDISKANGNIKCIMEESQMVSDPVQIALQTLKERCQQFEQRVIELETENVNLRLRCSKIDDSRSDSLTEIDQLKQRNTQLKEHNTQLKSNVQMVACENRQLWARLTKLMQVNKSLGNKLILINDSLMHRGGSKAVVDTSTNALVRSKTFTQNEPYLKHQQKSVVDESRKISLELEDISLKMISSIAKEKFELEAQCNEMMEMQASFGFAYPGDESEESVVEDLEQHVNDLKAMKETVLQEREILQKNIDNMKTLIVEHKCKSCIEKKNREIQSDTQEDKASSIDSAIFSKPNLNNGVAEEADKICPICSKFFAKDTQFNDFQNHVESHFDAELDPISHFEVL